jgi:hypothetical protein
VCSFSSHEHSWTSLLRPGTFLVWWALTRYTSRPCWVAKEDSIAQATIIAELFVSRYHLDFRNETGSSNMA